MSDRAGGPKVLMRRVRQRLRPEFARTIADPDSSLGLDMRGGTGTLLIAFGGLPGGIGMPPFEFFRITDGIKTKRLFVRDLRRAWYHEGVPGLGASFTGVGAGLSALLAEHDVKRIVVTGVSAGGYAAIAYGTLIGADAVAAFSPQTVIDLGVMNAFGDHRYDEQLGEIRARGSLDSRWVDLRAALPGARCAQTRCELHFDPESEPDLRHAERVAGLEGVTLVPHPGVGHNVPRALRQRGELKPLLLSLLSESGQADGVTVTTG